MVPCLGRLARALVARRPSGAAERIAAEQPRNAEEVVLNLSSTASHSRKPSKRRGAGWPGLAVAKRIAETARGGARCSNWSTAKS
eukprot:7894425-Pyramimonas_sp.AAC.1